MHSKGPWKFEGGGGTWYIRDAEGNALQCDEQYYPWVSNNEADWHLIAAAPDLLEALKDEISGVARLAGTCQKNVMGRCRCATCRDERSRAAIAKAEPLSPAPPATLGV